MFLLNSRAFAIFYNKMFLNTYIEQNDLSIHPVIIFTVYKIFFLFLVNIENMAVFFIKSKHYLVKKNLAEMILLFYSKLACHV